MARSLNRATLIGNTGAPPEIRTTGTGTKVAQFSVATSRSWTDSKGEKQEKTEWHRIVAWRGLADIIEKYLGKGDRVYIEGEIQYRSYEDKDKVTKYITEIVASEMILLSGRQAGTTYRDEARDAPPARSYAGAGAASGGGAEPPKEDDDLPF